jgi:hypothetical protein
MSSKKHIDLVYKANAIADDVCAPLLKSRDEAECWLTIAQRRYKEAWDGARAIAMKALKSGEVE